MCTFLEFREKLNRKIGDAEEKGTDPEKFLLSKRKINKIILLNPKKTTTKTNENTDSNSKSSDSWVHFPNSWEKVLSQSNQFKPQTNNFFIGPNLFKKKSNDSGKIPFFRIYSEKAENENSAKKRAKVSKKRFSKSLVKHGNNQKSRKSAAKIPNKKRLLEQKLMANSMLNLLKFPRRTDRIYQGKLQEMMTGGRQPRKTGDESKVVGEEVDGQCESLLYPNSTVPNDQSKLKTFQIVTNKKIRPLDFDNLLNSNHFEMVSSERKIV